MSDSSSNSGGTGRTGFSGGEIDLSFVRDVSERKRAEQLVSDTVAYAESIVETVREPLVILGQDLRVKTASRAFYQAFQVIPEKTENQLLTIWATASGTFRCCGLCWRRFFRRTISSTTSRWSIPSKASAHGSCFSTPGGFTCRVSRRN